VAQKWYTCLASSRFNSQHHKKKKEEKKRKKCNLETHPQTQALATITHVHQKQLMCKKKYTPPPKTPHFSHRSINIGKATPRLQLKLTLRMQKFTPTEL
jgi:hypothetical protein